jgi:hypothetical protein
LRSIFLVAACLVALGLAGCAAGGSPIVQSIQAFVNTGGTGVAKDAIPDTPDIRFSYLRVQVAGHPPGLMVLGYVDPNPAGPIEVWYSANRETLRLQNGRVISTTGTVQDWAAVQYAPAPPAWPDVTQAGTTFTRQRDAMPGYRFGIREQIKVQALSALPPVALPVSLPTDKAANYRWYRESVQPQTGQTTPLLPDAWFAWGKHRGVEQIVYSEQCMSPDFCLKLQRWPLLEEAD